jgi:hypothetical protein
MLTARGPTGAGVRLPQPAHASLTSPTTTPPAAQAALLGLPVFKDSPSEDHRSPTLQILGPAQVLPDAGVSGAQPGCPTRGAPDWGDGVVREDHRTIVGHLDGRDAGGFKTSRAPRQVRDLPARSRPAWPLARELIGTLLMSRTHRFSS